MATQLNIKDAGTIALVREIAERRGTSMTSTIRSLAEEEEARHRLRLEELHGQIQEITAGARDLLAPEWRNKSSVEIVNSIYNEDGSFAP